MQWTTHATEARINDRVPHTDYSSQLPAADGRTKKAPLYLCHAAKHFFDMRLYRTDRRMSFGSVQLMKM
jgi:hypothetical protein